ncbi:MAG: hypothetical protein LBP43_07280 [Treponema sp.]|jgi:class 3 adenylate cyclase|nr:hypothetical protein [Treponema sp.]
MAAGMMLLMMYVTEGPLLGVHYDFLLNYRPAPPVSPEITLIETGPEGVLERSFSNYIIEPATVAMVLLTMTELDGGALIIDAPILGLSSGEGENEGELLRRLNGEFTLLSRNIRNLFDAIRLGAVAPEESGRFVEELINLTEQGKERLVSVLVRRDEAETDRLDRAAAVFGKFWRPDSSGPAGELLPDRDGKLRRIAPIRSGLPASPGFFRRLFPRREASEKLPPEKFPPEKLPPETPPEAPVEHIVYRAIKTRYDSSEIEYSGDGPVLRNKNAGKDEDVVIPLDKGGAILFEAPRGEERFRRIPLAAFKEYDEADRTLYRLLKEGEGLGMYNGLAPEKRPPLIYEYILSLREDLLQNPAPGKKAAWIAARKDFFIGLEDFLAGPTEVNLVTGYEEGIAREDPGEAGAAQIRAMRDDLIHTFQEIRRQYINLREQRDRLSSALSASFCILGPATPVPGTSALLANALLTGRGIKPGADRHILFWSLGYALLVCLCIGGMGTFLSLSAGMILCALGGAAFSYSFIITGYWIDPLIPMAAAGAGVLCSSYWALVSRRRYKGWLRDAYEPFVPRNYLKRILRTGKPLPSQCLSVRAAVVAIRNTSLTLSEDQGEAPASARKTLAFRETAIRLFTRSGAVIAGSDGDMVLAVYGSPPERAAGRNGIYTDPGIQAAGFITELLKISPPEHLSGEAFGGPASGEEAEIASWHFGIDVGECAFVWSPPSGYTAFGRPVVRARILSGLTSRYGTRVLISAGVNEKLTQPVVRKLGTLKTRGGDEREVFYELVTGKSPGSSLPV